jgi:hypothetical protein
MSTRARSTDIDFGITYRALDNEADWGIMGCWSLNKIIGACGASPITAPCLAGLLLQQFPKTYVQIAMCPSIALNAMIAARRTLRLPLE